MNDILVSISLNMLKLGHFNKFNKFEILKMPKTEIKIRLSLKSSFGNFDLNQTED